MELLGYSPPSSPEVKNWWSYTLISPAVLVSAFDLCSSVNMKNQPRSFECICVTSKYAVQMEVAGFPKYRYLPTNPTMWYYITEIHNFKHIDSMVVVWQFASHLWVQKCHLGLIWFRWYHVGLWFTAVINNDFCFGTQLMCCRYGTYSFISLKVLDILIFHMCGINILGFHRSICSEVSMRASSNSVTRSCQILLGWLHQGEWEGQGIW